MKLSIATRTAEQIRDTLAAWCDRIEIAGSIRRGLPWCNDIDLVLQPKPGELKSVLERCSFNTSPVCSGPEITVVRLNNGVQLDLYFAHGASSDLLIKTPSNWGSLLLCRTGSKEHNVKIANRARSLGLKWEITRGIVDATGQLIASETEEEIFTALQMDFVAPANRQ